MERAWRRALRAGAHNVRGVLGAGADNVKGVVGRLRRGGREGRAAGPGGVSPRPSGRLGPVRAFLVLLTRSLRETARNHFVNGVRMVATIVLAGLFGVVWGQQHSVVDRCVCVCDAGLRGSPAFTPVCVVLG